MNSKNEIDLLIKNFNTQTLLKENWTHEAHLIVGTWFMKNFDFFDGICRLKASIILLNKFHQTDNHGHKGYHETLTIFWTKIIAIFIELYPDLSMEELVPKFLHSALADKALPFMFYEKEKLLSPAYRAIYFKETNNPLTSEAIRAILFT